MTRVSLLVILWMLAFGNVVLAESGPVLSDTGPDAEAYGASQGYPLPTGSPTPAQPFVAPWRVW